MEYKTIKAQCQNCGKEVIVPLDENGFYVGCVFCEECQEATSWSSGTEQIPYQNEY